MLMDYNRMPTEALVDLLAQETQKVTQLLMDKEFTDEYEVRTEMLKQLQAALAVRRQATSSAPGMSFTDPDSTA